MYQINNKLSVKNTDGVEGAPQREDRPRGGRGRGRGGPRRDGERRMDRRSGDPRSSVKVRELNSFLTFESRMKCFFQHLNDLC